MADDGQVSTPSNSQDDQVRLSRRRAPRITLACDPCRSRKVKCNGGSPCSGCQQTGHTCVYRTAKYAKRAGRQSYRAIVQGVRGPRTIDAANLATPTTSLTSSGLGPAPRLFNDPVHYKRQRELRAGIGVSDIQTGAFQFYGPSSHFCFVQRIYQRIKRRTNEPLATPHESPVPDGLGYWGIERFLFSVGCTGDGPKLQADVYLPRELGDTLIQSYFTIVHPQIPILNYPELMETWNEFWEPPSQHDGCGRELVYIVLAIGARVASTNGRQDSALSEKWAEHFYAKTKGLTTAFEEPSLRSTHFLILKAVYALLVNRANDVYLSLGHAARNAIALGINRSQVVEGANFTVHRLKVTFWTLYSLERSCALYTGRQSSFRDDQIDAPYPDDWPTGPDSAESPQYFQPIAMCGWVRAMAKIGTIADRVMVDIYSCRNMTSTTDFSRAQQSTSQCDIDLESILASLPVYLHFFDSSTPLGETWQEVQRINLGLNYYQTRMLMHRPALIFATFYDSKAEAQQRVDGTMRLFESIEASVLSAKNTIQLAHDVYFRRCPELRFEGSFSVFLITACVTLLYDVLDPETTPEYAKETFAVVEQGIQCLDEIKHIGPITGKVVSLDIMKVAKDALMSTRGDVHLDDDFLVDFPWLQDVANQPTVPFSPSNGSLPVPNQGYDSISTTVPAQVAPSDVNYMSHWLEGGFNPDEIPNCLF